MENEPYQVSVLVPVYGVEKYIERCARSIFEQTYHNLDIIFVDDCTPDHSIDVLKRVLEDYPERKEQTRIIKHERNRGLAAARNTGVAEAKGLFVTHVDSDDWIECDAVESMVAKQIESNADIVTGLACVNEKTIDKDYIEPEYSDKNEMLENILSQLHHHELWGRLINRSLYSHTDVYSLEGVNVGEDWRVLPLLLWYAKDISAVRETVYHYFVNESSLCRSEKSKEQLHRFLVQSFENFDTLWKFFKGKNSSYYTIAIKEAVHQCFFLLQQGLKDKDREFFYKWRTRFLKEYPFRYRKKVLGLKVNLLLLMPFSYFVLSKYFQLLALR